MDILEQQLRNFVAHMNTYRKKRKEFLASDDVDYMANYFNVTPEKLKNLLKSA